MMDCYNLTCPYQPVGKIKHEQSHACRTSISDVFVMFKKRRHVASQRIQGFLEAFSTVFFSIKMSYLVVSKKDNPLFV